MKRLLVALVLAGPGAALAQEAAPQLQEDPRAARYAEVERGLFTGFEFGYIGIPSAKVSDTAKFPYAAQGGNGYAGGFVVALDLGVDVTSRLAISALALGSNSQGNASYGAFDVIGGGGDVRFAFLALRDANGTERTFAYVHGRVAYVKSYPQALFATSEVLAGGGLGLEYFTRLRHFSVGLAVDGLFFTKAQSFAFSVAPTLRYTF